MAGFCVTIAPTLLADALSLPAWGDLGLGRGILAQKSPRSRGQFSLTVFCGYVPLVLAVRLVGNGACEMTALYQGQQVSTVVAVGIGETDRL